MIEGAWEEYLRLATVASTERRDGRLRTIVALGLVSAAALLAAAASMTAGFVQVGLLVAAAACAGGAGFANRGLFEPDKQQHWLRARLAAEAIRSECYRFAGRAGEYAGRAAARRFDERITRILEGMPRTARPVSSTAANMARPSPDMTPGWYLENRLVDQRLWFTGGATQAIRTARRMRALALTLSLGVTLLGAMTAVGYPSVAAFIAVGTTLGTGITALGVIGRYEFVAEAYLGVARSLDMIITQHRGGVLPDKELVTTGEDLLRTVAATVLATQRH
jgi:hypothetical protein